ncbi:MAG: nucleotide exchange factor GrpE [Deltaproteobacteria bacterium]|nr:nucleotide exchange factor GrpE [Deltaproteobacteria bacterium]
MSEGVRRRPPGGGGGEGWEGFAEEAAGTLGPSPELEDAMREAAESVEALHEHRKEPGAGGSPQAERAGSDPAEAESSELAELRDRYLRLAADFENFRKRTLKDREEAHHFGHQSLVKDLLPTVDNLERAVDHARKGGESSGLLEGVELVLRELEALLARYGVTPIEALGQAFDPALHEAMAQVPDASKPPHTVVEVFQRGYQLRGRLLRPARVVVSRPPEGSGADGRRDG